MGWEKVQGRGEMKIGTLPFILVAILFWASSFVGIRAALVDYDPIDIALLRFVISSIVFLRRLSGLF